MNRRLILAGLPGLLLVTTSRRLLAQTSEAYALITAEDVAERVDSGTRSLRRLASDGPSILVHAPGSSTVRPPVDFDVEFRARDGVPPDLRSIRLHYNLGIAWKNVTRRLMAHATFEGNRVLSANAMLPAGKHQLKLSIEDTQRRRTEALLDLEVL